MRMPKTLTATERVAYLNGFQTGLDGLETFASNPFDDRTRPAEFDAWTNGWWDGNDKKLKKAAQVARKGNR